MSTPPSTGGGLARWPGGPPAHRPPLPTAPDVVAVRGRHSPGSPRSPAAWAVSRSPRGRCRAGTFVVRPGPARHGRPFRSIFRQPRHDPTPRQLFGPGPSSGASSSTRPTADGPGASRTIRRRAGGAAVAVAGAPRDRGRPRRHRRARCRHFTVIRGLSREMACAGRAAGRTAAPATPAHRPVARARRTAGGPEGQGGPSPASRVVRLSVARPPARRCAHRRWPRHTPIMSRPHQRLGPAVGHLRRPHPVALHRANGSAGRDQVSRTALEYGRCSRGTS